LASQPDFDHRSQGRSNVFLAASLMLGSVPLPVRVRNLSASGALLDGNSLPPAGSIIRLVRGELSTDGQIAWQDHGQAGVRFSGAINVNAWVKRTGHAGQQRIDEAIASLRSDAPPAVIAEPVQPPSLSRISEELDAICERLAGSPLMVVELGGELVKLDTLAQTLRQLAGH
jgi:hypothetical protein